MVFNTGTPGISLQDLLKNCSRKIFFELLDNELRLLHQAIDMAKIDFESIRRVALALCNPEELLLSDTKREQVINLLPIEKARELLSHFDVQAKGNPFIALDHLRFSSLREQQILLSFFGLSEIERAPSISHPAVTDLDVRYGLFSHQRRVVDRLNSVLSAFPHKCLLHMPTGAGKTRTSMHLVSRHLQSNEPTVVVWLAQSTELLDQATAEFSKAWEHLGNRKISVCSFYGQYSPDLQDLHDGVLVAGFAKMHALNERSPNMLPRIGDRCSLVIVDEAHQSIAPTYRKVTEIISKKRLNTQLLGLTATPGRSWNDIAADAELAEFFGAQKVMLEIPGHTNPVEYLISEGYLAKPTFKQIFAPQTLGAVTDPVDDSGDYPSAVLDALSCNKERNALIVEAAESLLSRHSRVILFAASVYHAKIISAILKEKGFDSEVITADTPLNLRARTISKFRSRDATSKVICNFGVLTTGFDAPNTSAALIARPTRSLVLYSQMVGRAIRGPKQGGNTEAEIYTVIDSDLPGFGSIADAFMNWEDVWNTDKENS